jgi:hypothetical protein
MKLASYSGHFQDCKIGSNLDQNGEKLDQNRAKPARFRRDSSSPLKKPHLHYFDNIQPVGVIIGEG